ncbi:hypothetical protein C5167_023938 [Papaver somniferum]|uniref:Uncharacterized protein n=1 Tax=Papaver somniferum TaxID=3469 RepID=A0A4Y7JR60_PAPSO|nr:hypothetical protein C5167_023938 [Papaver somniferum]
MGYKTYNRELDILTLGYLYDVLNWDLEDPKSCDLNKRISEILNPKAISDPRNVSIGPHHYGKPQLYPMQADKLRALRHFVKRGRPSIDSYIQALLKCATPIRDSYEKLDETWQDNNRFVILMLLDGVFLLEFLSVTRGNQKYSDYNATDPIFGHQGHMLIYEVMMQDLLMLTNQLPYLVLSTLLSVSEGLPEKGLLAGGQRSHEEDLQQQEDKNEKISFSNLYYKCGVKCVRVQSFDKISFNRKTGTLELPTVHINKQSIPEFVNLILYERQEGTSMNLNSYFYLLGLLIQSPKDVNQLRSQGIIVNSLSSDEAVMEQIKEISKETVQGDRTCLSNLVPIKLKEYYKRSATKRSHKLFLHFTSQHFKNMPAFLIKYKPY